jgi:poly-gamma-glutamate synthesis protein (capsule biosynthesis protein)
MPLLLDKNGVRIAIVNCCENEWSVASEDRAGANPLDVIENLAQIRKARNMAGFLFWLLFMEGSEIL